MFRYRLAGYLGKTVAELERDADPWEIAHWMALQRIDGPIGEQRDDLRAIMASSPVGAEMPLWDSMQREKYEAAQLESARLQRAQRQLRGGQ